MTSSILDAQEQISMLFSLHFLCCWI